MCFRHPTNRAIFNEILGVEIILAEEPVYGAHYGAHYGGPGVGKVVIDGDFLGTHGTEEQHTMRFCHVLAHEIGHVMTGDSHPHDDGYKSELIWEGPNDERLLDPFLRKRLMCNGFVQDKEDPGTCLIKAEWDRIEAWLNAHVKDDE